MSNRKPYNDNAGYVSMRISKHLKLPGYFIVYDRDADPSPGIDADFRWIVLHQPSTRHISMPSRQTAYDLMKAMASGSNMGDFGQND